MLDSLHYEDYAQVLNTKFKAQINETSTMEMELVEVKDNSPSPLHEQFVLTFLAPVSASVAQQMFMVYHEQLGNGLIFLVPIAKDAAGVTYEAVFNRVKSK